MNTLQVFWKTTWRSVLVAVGYVIGLMLAGMIGAILGVQMEADTSGAANFVWMILAAFLLGIFLGPFAARLSLTRMQHFILWGSLILFNLGSVAIEGAYFAPDLVPLPIPMLLAQQASGVSNCRAGNHVSVRKDRTIHFMDECTPHSPVVFMDYGALFSAHSVTWRFTLSLAG